MTERAANRETNPERATWFKAAEDLAEEFRRTGAQRDRAGAVPFAEIDALRQAGLLNAALPVAYGGGGASWTDALSLVRIVARGDSSIGQLLGYHYVNAFQPVWGGSEEQARRLLSATTAEGLYWAAAVNPRDPSLTLTRSRDAYVLNGRKTFSTGIRLAQRVNVAATLDGTLATFVVSPDRPGITFGDDWDNIGQRLTDSGSVQFRDFPVYEGDFFGSAPDRAETTRPFATINTPLIQLLFAGFYLGTAEGALAEAIGYLRTTTRPWYTSGVDQARHDPLILERIGEFSASVQASVALAEKAAEGLQHAYEKGVDLTADERTAAAFPAYAAKVSATHVALDVTARIFEVMGARATAGGHGYDRFWRNVRTHTLHDPVFYKARDIGAYLLNGTVPPVDLYT